MIQKVIISLLTVCLIALGYLHYSVQQDAYINLQDVYHGFQYQQSLNTELESYKRYRFNELDSLNQEFQKYYDLNKDQTETLQLKHQELQKYKEQVISQIEKIELETENKIWDIINKEVRHYGIHNEISYIFGVSGSGTLMYADTTNNVTDEIVKSLNKVTYE